MIYLVGVISKSMPTSISTGISSIKGILQEKIQWILEQSAATYNNILTKYISFLRRRIEINVFNLNTIMNYITDTLS